MNIMHLIKRHPLLYADLRHLGLPTTSIRQVADLISAQLGGQANLCMLLASLDRQRFINHTDVADIAQQTGLTPSTVQSVIFTIAPWVERFRMTQQVS